MKSISRILGGLNYSRVGEESPKGRRGRNIPRETCTLYFTFEPAAPSERTLHECAYNSETNGDGVKMFNSDECVRVEHLRPHAPSEMWTPA